MRTHLTAKFEGSALPHDRAYDDLAERVGDASTNARSPITRGVVQCLDFLAEAAARGERTALVTISDVIGGSSRNPGTHMAIGESGAWRGSFSGGCVEAAVASEARRIIETGRGEVIRFGADSPYIDIRLPCGGGIDLLFTPNPGGNAIAQAQSLLDQRRPFAFELSRGGGVAVGIAAADLQTGWLGETFISRHEPQLKLFVIGQGEEAEAVTALSLAYGAQTVVLTPDAALAEICARRGAAAHVLRTPSPSPWLAADPWSAILFLFHDHDWETELLAQALDQQPCFIGAMGSPGTHAMRLDRLRNKGIAETELARITGPVGLIPSTREPETLALSALAQIVSRYRGET